MSALQTEAPPAAVPRSEPPPSTGRVAGRAVPYLLVTPTLLVLAAVLGYPLLNLVTISFQKYRIRNLLGGKGGEWIGLDNYLNILTDGFFWTVVLRTVVFTVVNVGLTLLLATLIAVLMRRVSRWTRGLLSFGLVFVWALPPVVAVPVWQWMVDYQFGVFNWLITRLGIADYTTHNWFTDPLQGFVVITAVVVWGAIPFAAITLYAGLTQVPQELTEAAVVDGATAWQVFRNVTWPILKPVYAILTTLSIIWDFQVFNQVWVMLNQNPPKDYWLLGVYAYATSFGGGQNLGLGAAIAMVTVLILLGFTFFHIRQMLRVGEVR